MATKRVPQEAPQAKKVPRTSVIKVRLTADQRRVLEHAARMNGLDLSSWLRMVSLRAAGWAVTPDATERP